MPYASKAQARAMHAKAARGEISQKTVHEFDKATDFKHLPERKKHMSKHEDIHGHDGKMRGAAGSHESEDKRAVHKTHKRIWTGHHSELMDSDGSKGGGKGDGQ